MNIEIIYWEKMQIENWEPSPLEQAMWENLIAAIDVYVSKMSQNNFLWGNAQYSRDTIYR